MVRPLGFLVGLGFIAALVLAIFTTPLSNEENVAHSFHKHPRHLKLASDGIVLPHWDKAQLQRGMQVYKEVCSACHSLHLVAFRDIADLGYNEGQVKSFAKSYDNIPSINPDTGEPATRTGLPSDYFPSPYPNEVAARAANNNALPPDLSLITKAREGGKDYVYSLLTGFQNPPKNLPKELQPSTGLHYNPYFANLNLAMAPPLNKGQVTYADGTEASVDQMAKDVTAFLVWTAEPRLIKRVQVGYAVFFFLLIFTILAYLSYRNIWADKKH